MNESATMPCASAPATAPDLITLPAVGLRIGIGVDQLRIALKRRPELKSFFKQYGPTRLMDANRVEEFRQKLNPQPASLAN